MSKPRNKTPKSPSKPDSQSANFEALLQTLQPALRNFAGAATQPDFSPESAELSLLRSEMLALQEDLRLLRDQARAAPPPITVPVPAAPPPPPNFLDNLVETASGLIPLVGPLLALL